MVFQDIIFNKFCWKEICSELKILFHQVISSLMFILNTFPSATMVFTFISNHFKNRKYSSL